MEDFQLAVPGVWAEGTGTTRVRKEETHGEEQRRQRHCVAPGAGMRMAESRRGLRDAQKVQCAPRFLDGCMDLLETIGRMYTSSLIFHKRKPASQPNPFVLFGKEPHTHRKATASKRTGSRKESLGSHTIPGVTWEADEVVFDYA